MVWAHCGKELWFGTGKCYCMCGVCFMSQYPVFCQCTFYLLSGLFYPVPLHKAYVYLFPILFCFGLLFFVVFASKDAPLSSMTQPSSQMELLPRWTSSSTRMCFKMKEENHFLWPLLTAPESYIWPLLFFSLDSQTDLRPRAPVLCQQALYAPCMSRVLFTAASQHHQETPSAQGRCFYSITVYFCHNFFFSLLFF